MSNFFKVSEAGSIALHAMILLAVHPARLISTKEIAESFKISEAHLAKVLNRLVKTGLVTATRGPSGGYKLNRPVDDISLKEIYETIEGNKKENKCMFDIPLCDGSGCSLGDFFSKESNIVEEKLSHTKLSDIILRPHIFKDINNM